jgi:hypothetical protein
VDDEKYQRQDQKEMNEKSGDVKRDERRDPDENKNEGEPQEDESHAGSSVSDRITQSQELSG